MFYSSIPTPYGTMRADDAVRVDDADVRANAAGSLAWWSTYLCLVHECDGYCEPGCTDYASDMADRARQVAERKAYARAYRNN